LLYVRIYDIIKIAKPSIVFLNFFTFIPSIPAKISGSIDPEMKAETCACGVVHDREECVKAKREYKSYLSARSRRKLSALAKFHGGGSNCMAIATPGGEVMPSSRARNGSRGERPWRSCTQKYIF